MKRESRKSSDHFHHSRSVSSMGHLTLAVALEEQGPKGLVTGIIFLISFLLVAALLWASFTIVHETARAPGEIVPSDYAINIQHMEGGTVKKLYVRDGDKVGAGDTLLLLDDTLLRSELEQLKVREAAYNLEYERLNALLENREPDFGIYEKHFPHLAAKQRMIFQAQRMSHQRERQVIESQIEQKRHEIRRQENLVLSLERETGLLKEQVAMRRRLSNNELLSRNELLTAQTRLAETESELIQAKGNVLVAKAALAEARQRKLELEADFLEQIEMEAGRISAKLAEIDKTLPQLADRVRRLEIKAPVSGTIQNLTINNDLSVVEAGQIIMQIIPAQGELIVSAKVSPSDIGHVQKGNPADIRVDSYDTVRFGMLKGEVRQISATTYLDNNNRPYYKVEIALHEDYLGTTARPLRLIPGMTVVADIRTGEKTVLDYLLRPIRRGFDSAFQER